MSFNFAPEEKWAVSTDALLPAGNHVCEVLEIEAGPDCRSKSNYPEVRVKVGNQNGALRDWITISSQVTFGKFTALVLAAGFDEADWPVAGEDFSTDDGHVMQAYANKLLGKKVGVVAREELDLSGNPRVRVKGYVPAADLAGKESDATPAGSAMQFAGSGTRSKPEDDIPF